MWLLLFLCFLREPLFLFEFHFGFSKKDVYFTAKRPFSYVFNVCDDVTEPQSDADCGGSAAAYQLIGTSDSPPSGKCTKLGRTSQYNWELVDGDNALTGVQLVYRNGTAEYKLKWR